MKSTSSRIFLALAVVGVVACGSATWYMYTALYHNLKESLIAEESLAARKAMNQVDDELYRAQLGILTIAGDYYSQLILGGEYDTGGHVEAHRRMDALVNFTSTWNKVLLVDTKGIIQLTNYQRHEGQKIHLTDQLEALVNAREGKAYISDPIKDSKSGEVYSLFSAPVHSKGAPGNPKKGEVIGVAIGYYNWLRAREILEQQSSTYLCLFNKGGTLLATNNKEIQGDILSSKYQSHPIVQGKLFGKPMEETQESLDQPGEKVFTIFTNQHGRFEFRPRGWFLVSEIHQEALLESIQERALPMVLLQGLFVIITFSVVAFILNREVVSPLKKLHDASDKLAQGEFDTRIDTSGMRSDIQDFGETFNNMAASLQATDEKRVSQLEEKVKELDRFAYVASHDLRSPLKGIQTLMQWIDEDCSQHFDEESKSNFELVKKRCDRLDRLLVELLNYSRIGVSHGTMKEVDIGTVWKDFGQLLDPENRYKVRSLGMLPKFITLNAPLELLIRNLLDNAIKHHDKPEGNILLSAEDSEDGEFYIFSIQDDGPGIDPKYHERIFGIFETLAPKDRVEGTGMGLSFIKKTLETYGGKVWVESDVGKGTTFRFTWPKKLDIQADEKEFLDTVDIKKEHSKNPWDVKAYDPKEWKGGDPPHILMVENDNICSLSMEQALHKISPETKIERVEDGESCLNAIAKWNSSGGQTRRIVLLDLNLPRDSGTEILHELRNNPKYSHPESVFILTSSKNPTDIKESSQYHIAGYLVKPDSREGFEQIARHLVRHLALNQFPENPEEKT